MMNYSTELSLNLTGYPNSVNIVGMTDHLAIIDTGETRTDVATATRRTIATEDIGTKAIIDVIAMMTGIVIHLVASDPAHLDVVVTNAGAPRPLEETLKKGEWKLMKEDMTNAPDMKMVALKIAVVETMKGLLRKDGMILGSKMRTEVGGECGWSRGYNGFPLERNRRSRCIGSDPPLRCFSLS
jgi:hypothetical protein